MNKFLYWFLMTVVLIVLNSASIVWIVNECLPDPILSVGEKFFNWKKLTTLLFMGVGVFSSLGFIKWLFVDTLTQIREKAKEKKNNLYKKFRKEIDNAC